MRAEYTGWQRSSHTTPDALFDMDADRGRGEKEKEAAEPFWAQFIEANPVQERRALEVKCTPEESRLFLIRHVQELFSGTDEKTLIKIF